MDYLARKQDELAKVVPIEWPLEKIAEAFETIEQGWAEDGRHAVTDSFVIGCDVGSQGTNAALYGADGELVASAYEAYDLSFPHPAGPSRTRTCGRLRSSAPVGAWSPGVPAGAAAIHGLSFGSQLDGMVVCDSSGRRLHPR